MKIDLAHTDRGYMANLLRRRRDELAQLAGRKSGGDTKAEFDLEQTYVEALATRLDRGEEAEKAAPITADPRVDIDSVDKPATPEKKP